MSDGSNDKESDLEKALNIALAALGHFNTEQTDEHWNKQERILREIEKRMRRSARSAGTASTDDARDAARWRKFNEVAKRNFNYDNGSIRFYLPREGFGFQTFEETVDAYIDPASVARSARTSTMPPEANDLVRMRRDARRYCWLRDHDMTAEYDEYITGNMNGRGVDPLDATIDKAMEKECATNNPSDSRANK